VDDQQVRVGGEKRHERFRLLVTETPRRKTRQDENERCLGAQSEAVEGSAFVFESLGSADDLLFAATLVDAEKTSDPVSFEVGDHHALSVLGENEGELHPHGAAALRALGTHHDEAAGDFFTVFY
jgi:hypothetical protein